MLLDPTYKVPGVFVGGCNLCNPVIKEGLFCRSCSRVEQMPILSGSCASISCKYISVLIVPPLLRSSSDSKGTHLYSQSLALFTDIQSA